MKKIVSGIMLTLLLACLVPWFSGSMVKRVASVELPSAYPFVYVYPESVKVNVGDYFTISVVVYNLTDAKVRDPEYPAMWIPLGNLYGFDIQFSWDPTIIKYVNHTVTVPVEDYPNPIPPSPYPGILHKPTLAIVEMVDEADNIPGAADPRVRAWFSFASMAPADPFNGNGTLFTMTFQAIKNGISPLEIVDCTLADINGGAIAIHKCSQKLGQWLNPPRNGEAIVGTPPKEYIADINGDGKVDICDVTLAASQYMKKPGDSDYNITIVSRADLAPPYDGIINILDLVTIAAYYGKTYP